MTNTYRLNTPSGVDVEAGIATLHTRPVNPRHNRRKTRTRVYFRHQGETVPANFGNRHARPTDIYRKVWRDHVTPAHPGVAAAKLTWNRHAGCSVCPCSPGFVVDGAIVDDDGRLVDVWVTVGPECPPTTDPALAAAYTAQLAADPTIAPLLGGTDQ